MCTYRKEYAQISLRIPASSIRYRKEFNLAHKDINETMDDWYNRLRELAVACEYGSHLDAFLLHQFICGLDESILEHLSAEDSDLSFTSIIDSIKTYERSNETVVVKPEIKQEEPQSSDGEQYNDNYSIDSGDENDASYEDNIKTIVPFMAQTVIESQPSQSSQPLRLSQPIITDITNLFECYLCHKSWRTVGQLTYHFIQYHTTGKAAICHLCGKFIRDSSNMIRHLNVHLSTKKYRCDVCDLTFSRLDILKNHVIKHNVSNRKAFKCTRCDKKFLTKRHLNIHKKTHSEPTVSLSEKLDELVKKRKSIKAKAKATADSTFKCEICSTSFEDEGARDNHMKVHFETEWLCHLCGKKMANKRNLTHHYRIHNNEKPFKCSGCDKYFASKEKLKLHSRTHTGDRPHVCTICSKGFLQKGHLAGHIAGHSKFKCGKCSREFIKEQKYQEHILRHEILKPHACTLCDKTFKYKSVLIEHERTHTGEKPLVCTICDKRFTHSSTLRGHLKWHAKPKVDRPKKKRKTKAEKSMGYSVQVYSIQPTATFLG